MNQVRVSFIIPVLNADKDIGRCLKSIRDQKFPPEKYEVLVVDNGSTDTTCQIVRGFGFSLQIIPKVSVAALRNRGAKSARGEYLAFVDADVEIMPNWLKEGLKVFESSSIVAAGCFPRAPRPSTWVQQTWEIHQCGKRHPKSKASVSWLPSMNLLVDRDAFHTINGFDEGLVTAEDVDLCYRLARLGTILSVPAMEAVHWGEAANLATFWRKEVWRGKGSLKGIGAHGLRWDELPSIGYPIYIVCLAILLSLSCVLDMWNGRITLIALSLGLLILPALILAINTIQRGEKVNVLPRLFVLYLLYGLARAYSMVAAFLHQRS